MSDGLYLVTSAGADGPSDLPAMAHRTACRIRGCLCICHLASRSRAARTRIDGFWPV